MPGVMQHQLNRRQFLKAASATALTTPFLFHAEIPVGIGYLVETAICLHEVGEGLPGQLAQVELRRQRVVVPRVG